MGAARSSDVAAVVAESPFASMDHAVTNHFHKVFGPATPIIVWPVRFAGEYMIGCSCARIAPVREIGQIAPRPVLLIQDEADDLCPPAETRTLYRAAREPK